MKKARVRNISGLACWLSENKIEWYIISNEPITDIYIYYKKKEDLFRIGFLFGQIKNNVTLPR